MQGSGRGTVQERGMMDDVDHHPNVPYNQSRKTDCCRMSTGARQVQDKGNSQGFNVSPII